MRSTSRKRLGAGRGFTIIEVLVVIAVAGVLLALATPSMARFVAEWRVKDAANSIIGQLRLARVEAIRTSRPVILCPSASGGASCAASTATEWKDGWLLFVDNDNSGTYASSKDKLLKKQGPLKGLAGLTKNQDGYLTFWPTGIMRLSAGTSRLSIGSSYQEDGQSVIQNYYCIGSTGRVRKLPAGTTAC